ncbi:MAG: tetratricopeptide repeat protein [Flavobacteriaceae bacterium]
MIKRLMPLFVLLMCVTASAQNEALFNKGTDAYNEGEYEKAIQNYMGILNDGQHSAELYFNLGNTHYKLNQIAPSIYYYEKALLLQPKDAEILNNLAYAQNMTLDAIEILPETGISKIYTSISRFLSFDQWAYAAVTFIILFVFLYIAFYYFKYATQKRLAFISSLVSLVIGVVSFIFAFVLSNDFKADRPAIVFADEVTIKSEPNDRSQEVFKLHEGTKVNVLEELNDWKKIRIIDGKTGWVASSALKVLKDF